jgi:hypothetical protein
MLRAIEDLNQLSIGARDGEIGTIKDAYFDDHDWTLRYLVVATGGWLSGRKVLIAPWSIRGMRWEEKLIDVDLTRAQVSESPSIDTDKPVSRQHEIGLLDYYGYPYYWSGPLLWGGMAFPRDGFAAGPDELRQRQLDRSEKYDPHLRSADEMTAYGIEASDGSIGQVQDFLYDDETWSIRYLVVDTRRVFPGKHVLISMEWVEEVDWSKRKLTLALTREAIRESPEYLRDMVLLPEDEARLYTHYGRAEGRAWSRGRSAH